MLFRSYKALGIIVGFWQKAMELKSLRMAFKEKSPGEGKGYPLQYSGLENSIDCTVHGSQTQLSHSRLWLLLSSWRDYVSSSQQDPAPSICLLLSPSPNATVSPANSAGQAARVQWRGLGLHNRFKSQLYHLLADLGQIT